MGGFVARLTYGNQTTLRPVTQPLERRIRWIPLVATVTNSAVSVKGRNPTVAKS